ncbi:serine/threonine-protein kinase [Streptomyces sp. AC512_CC834]|uniref:serine/threonine-protein kinase n=1 Tax=Streptomyces sp. AC512_CC834 TaxID=2823691 RepID=UPI001C2755C7|nr:serine/threonine-protein kinase [Streptomyces sp. AC512_CC834]
MGEVFAGRYELVDPIGRGGVGAVWRAWDHRRRRYVAAKVLQQRDAHSLLRFVREQALRIDHPHVLAPASWAADDDQVLFTMDLVTGGSLVHLVGDYGPLPPAFVCTLLDQLLAGLAAVHGEGVVHRDIKPANLLLEATGTGRPRLRLSDFGIAMRLGEPRLTETNLVVGTPGYLAPEQLMGEEPDFPADLFAVGLVALYLLEGAKPDAKALVQHFLEGGTPPAPQGIPEPLWQVVATLVQPDPPARFRTATGARKALTAAAELLPEPGPDDELIEIFDQVGPLPSGFGSDGPLKRASGVDDVPTDPRRPAGPGAAPAGAPPWTAAPPAGPPGAQDRTPAAPDRTPSAPADPLPSGTPPTGAGPLSESAPGAGRTGGSGSGSGSVSETGSFHLPPPQPTVTSAPAADARSSAQSPAFTGGPQYGSQDRSQDPPQDRSPGGSQYQPPPHVPPFPAAQALAPSPPRPADAPTAAYTAVTAQTAPPAQHRGGRRRRRSGPPARVALPLLLLALACYAVGFWALTRI